MPFLLRYRLSFNSHNYMPVGDSFVNEYEEEN